MIKLPGPFRGLSIGLFGGSFNPAHGGHLHVAETALAQLGIDWVWWLPAAGNPLKTQADDYPARLASARAMAAHHPRMLVSDLEQQFGTRYTLDTLCRLMPRLVWASPVWIMGADSLASFHKWGGWQDIALKLPIAVVDRPGFGLKARNSVFAKTFADARVRTQHARGLATRPAPAWVYLPAPLHPASSSAIRHAARLRNPFRGRSHAAN